MVLALVMDGITSEIMALLFGVITTIVSPLIYGSTRLVRCPWPRLDDYEIHLHNFRNIT